MIERGDCTIGVAVVSDDGEPSACARSLDSEEGPARGRELVLVGDGNKRPFKGRVTVKESSTSGSGGVCNTSSAGGDVPAPGPEGGGVGGEVEMRPSGSRVLCRRFDDDKVVPVRRLEE